MTTRHLLARTIGFFQRQSESAFWRRLTRESPQAEAPGTPLRVLTIAAMALPGMATAVELEPAQIQFSKYQEGGRDFWSGPTGSLEERDPIEVDQLHLSAGAWFTDRLRFAFDFLQDTWSGATPILTAPEAYLTVTGASAYPRIASFSDDQLVPYGPETVGGQLVPQAETVHLMSSASAETRQQGDLMISRGWNETTLDLGVGMSDEPDFESRYVSINARHDLNQKLTTLNAGYSYTSSDVDVVLGPIVDWTDYGHYLDAPTNPTITTVEANGQLIQVFSGDRTDWSATAGLTQVLSKNSTVATGLTYTHNSGFLENPYKLVMFAFADPAVSIGELQLTRLFNVPEDRPDVRKQWTWNTRWSHYFAGLDGAAHLDYRFSDDDWGITSHTFEADWSQPIGNGWLVTPRIRYYSQDAADFYKPYFILAEAAPIDAATGGLDFASVPIQQYSSDHRLSGFGALSAGLTIRKLLSKGISLEGGVEYYAHKGDLKLGGGGENGYADFHYYMLNLALRVALATESTGFSPDVDHEDHTEHAEHAGMQAPAALMYGHMLEEANSFMMGYRYMHARQSTKILHGTDVASDAEIIANGCGDAQCSVTPDQMAMNMHMLDLMYAPRDWLTLMVMLQYMDMEMILRPLEGADPGGGGHHGGGHTDHTTAGIGDTALAAMVKLVDRPSNDLHMGLAVSVPTGDIDKKTTDGQFLHYGMQPGSGTWDFQPSLTYLGQLQRWSWGGQLSGIIRGNGPNDSGYTLGNMFQTTAWVSRDLLSWLSASVRGVYTTQGEVDGQFDPPQAVTTPADSPDSYGGDFWDIGVGLSLAVPGRALQGDRINIEWLQPVVDDVNGYQLERDGSLSFTWTIGFD